MQKRNLILAAVILIVVVAAGSIGAALMFMGQNNLPTPTPTPTNTPTETPNATPTPTSSPSELPLTLTDNTNHTITLTAYPQRIVSLAPANTQILFAVGAGDKVIAVTDYDNYPYNFSEWVKAGNMTSIGSYYDPAIEPIVALNPDLIIAAQGSLDQATQLTNLGYKVIALNPITLNDVLGNILLIGKATNHTTDAQTVVNSLQQRIDAVTNAVANSTTKPKVYVEIYSSPYMSAGQGTFIDGLIKLAGGQNIFENATTQWPEVSVEAIIAQNPDKIVFPTSMGEDLTGSFDTLATREGWSAITAIKNNATYLVNADALNQPGPRQVNALEDLARIIHPEIFGNYTYQP
jgi:iron complex transport system substrate-binding protein